VTAPTSLAHS